MNMQYKAEVLVHTNYCDPYWMGTGSVRDTYEDAKHDIDLFLKHNSEWGNWTVTKARIVSRVPDWESVMEVEV